MRQLGRPVASDKIKSEVYKILEIFAEFENKRRFQLIGREEADFRLKKKKEIEQAAKLLAAVESRAADNRAETIKNKHPLGIQVHLGTGVANGVLVARSAKQCARLVRGTLTWDLKFDIKKVKNPKTEETLATILSEKETGSRFRVVTKDECLTNSFWNFYFGTEQCYNNIETTAVCRGG
jgi:hypothetical protein